jgi:hypothetical protein
VVKIPASIESSSNQRYQEFRGENKEDSATYHNFKIKKTAKIFITRHIVSEKKQWILSFKLKAALSL